MATTIVHLTVLIYKTPPLFLKCANLKTISQKLLFLPNLIFDNVRSGIRTENHVNYSFFFNWFTVCVVKQYRTLPPLFLKIVVK